jgi:membrane-associated protease RseP (regulator of RpoE activity)
VLSTLFVGAFTELSQAVIQPEMDFYAAIRAMLVAVVRYPALLLTGVPFALTLMTILLTHEMGHYIVGRRYDAPVSLPYFIPLPMPGSFGTMGAVIVQRAPFEDRKSLFDIGVAGPLAGLVVALPLLVYGLMTSQVAPITLPALLEGNSILYLAIKYLVFGRILPSQGVDVMLNPIAWAAWGGLFITSFNLLPIGQLDGGHTLYALLGRRAWNVAMGMVALLVVLSLRYPGWLFLAFLALIVGVRHPAPLNDLTPLDLKRKLLGIGVAILLILIFTPIPFTALN